VRPRQLHAQFSHVLIADQQLEKTRCPEAEACIRAAGFVHAPITFSRARESDD